MALSPYVKPTDPWKPNGISHYVLIANRKTVKTSWKAWVASYHAVTTYNNNPRGPITGLTILSGGTGYTATANHLLSYDPLYNLKGMWGGNTGINAEITISSVSTGAITGVTITTAGTSYRVGDILKVQTTGSQGFVRVSAISFTPQTYPAAFDYAGLYTNGAP